MAMRITVYIVLFLVFMHAAPAMLDSAGLTETHGLNPDTGAASSQIDAAKDRANDAETSGGGLQTLFGLYATLGRVWDAIVNIIYPGAEMVKNIGVPNLLVNFLMSGLTLFSAMDVFDYIRSGGLTG